jgi:integrase
MDEGLHEPGSVATSAEASRITAPPSGPLFRKEREALDAEHAARHGIAPSARAGTIQGWSMVWLRDYELRHMCATLLLERGLPSHVVANQLGHTGGGALVQRLYGHPSGRGTREQTHLALSEWDAERMQAGQRTPANPQVSQ